MPKLRFTYQVEEKEEGFEVEDINQDNQILTDIVVIIGINKAADGLVESINFKSCDPSNITNKITIRDILGLIRRLIVIVRQSSQYGKTPELLSPFISDYLRATQTDGCRMPSFINWILRRFISADEIEQRLTREKLKLLTLIDKKSLSITEIKLNIDGREQIVRLD